MRERFVAGGYEYSTALYRYLLLVGWAASWRDIIVFE